MLKYKTYFHFLKVVPVANFVNAGYWFSLLPTAFFNLQYYIVAAACFFFRYLPANDDSPQEYTAMMIHIPLFNTVLSTGDFLLA